MIVEVIDSNSKDFPPHTEFDFADFIVWLHFDMLPSHFIFECFGKYWRSNEGYACSEDETYSAPSFALYRGRLGLAEDGETKTRILEYIATQEDMRYRVMADALSISNACVGYHIADLKMRGLVETDPLSLTAIGEETLDFLNANH